MRTKTRKPSDMFSTKLMVKLICQIWVGSPPLPIYYHSAFTCMTA